LFLLIRLSLTKVNTYPLNILNSLYYILCKTGDLLSVLNKPNYIFNIYISLNADFFQQSGDDDVTAANEYIT